MIDLGKLSMTHANWRIPVKVLRRVIFSYFVVICCDKNPLVFFHSVKLLSSRTQERFFEFSEYFLHVTIFSVCAFWTRALGFHFVVHSVCDNPNLFVPYMKAVLPTTSLSFVWHRGLKYADRMWPAWRCVRAAMLCGNFQMILTFAWFSLFKCSG